MQSERNAYINPYVAEQFNEMVTRDTAKQVIYEDVTNTFIQMQSASASPLTFADMACGTGQFVEHLQSALPISNVVYADYSKAQLAIANRKIEHTSAFGVCLDLEKGIPLADKSVDGIASHFAFSEVPHIGDLLKEYNRVLKEDGICAVSMTSPISDLIIAKINPEKIEGIENDRIVPQVQRTDAEATGTYLLGNTIKVPHYYRPLSKIIQAFHANGFHLTAEDIVRFYPIPNIHSLPLPLPEYLLLYGRKDTRKYFGHFRRTREHAETQIPVVRAEVYSENPKETFIRVKGNMFDK